MPGQTSVETIWRSLSIWQPSPAMCMRSWPGGDRTVHALTGRNSPTSGRRASRASPGSCNAWGSKQRVGPTLQGADQLYHHLFAANVRGLGQTNISKMLALSLPGLCVMWDSGIRQDFLSRSRRHRGIAPQPRAYRRFLEQRQREIVDLIEQAMATRRVSKANAIAWLRGLPTRVDDASPNKPLAKLIDEYYYWKKRCCQFGDAPQVCQ